MGKRPLRLSELARLVVRLDHVASFIVNANDLSFRFESLNGITHSTLPLESKMRIWPERKLARPCA